jgi:hypothetical protein
MAAFRSFIANKKTQLACYAKSSCLHFKIIDNHNNKIDINTKTLQLGYGGESVKTLFTFSVPNDIPYNLLQ